MPLRMGSTGQGVLQPLLVPRIHQGSSDTQADLQNPWQPSSASHHLTSVGTMISVPLSSALFGCSVLSQHCLGRGFYPTSSLAHRPLSTCMEHRTKPWSKQDTSLLKALNNDFCTQCQQCSWGHISTVHTCSQNTTCKLSSTKMFTSSKVLSSTSLQRQLGTEKQAASLSHTAQAAQKIFNLCLTCEKHLFDCIFHPAKQGPLKIPPCRCGEDALSSTLLQWNKALLQDCWDKP